ncbi:hypothetical protein EU546_08620 [Candidatus Thorarchaeota archaeon]|nr:MAG: hypothetical protein EU546_08620 [Candidatus Thorarchaeota archaeon]
MRGWAKEFDNLPGWHILILVGYHTPRDYLGYLHQEGIPYLMAGDGHVDLEAVFKRLHSRLGVDCILATPGGRLGGALLRAGLIDEVNIEIVPGLVGGSETPSLYDSPDLTVNELPTKLDLLSTHTDRCGHVWLRYRVLGPIKNPKRCGDGYRIARHHHPDFKRSSHYVVL